MRPLVFVLLVGCGGSPEKPQQPAALPTPSASASASAAATKSDDGPLAQVRETIGHWLDLLGRGEDERFIDEAVVPEDLEHVLGSRTKAELVAAFKEDKHDDLVKALRHVRRAKPDNVIVEGSRTYVEYDGDRDVKHIRFVVEGAHVWLKN